MRIEVSNASLSLGTWDRSTMRRLLVYFVIAIASGVGLIFLESGSTAFMLLSAVSIGFLVPVVDACIRHWDLLAFAWMSLRTWGADVRISVSYLYRIKVQGHYLLIKSRRFNHFQPVGGVFKYFPAGQAVLRNEIHARDDDLYPIDNEGIGDLRFTIKGRHLASFFDWFNRRRGRETDVWREFQEELIAPGYLPVETFKYVRADYIGTRHTGVRWSDYAQRKEIVFAEIYELVPTPEQEAVLAKMIGESHAHLHWATASEIARRGAGASTEIVPISDHSRWIL